MGGDLMTGGGFIPPRLTFANLDLRSPTLYFSGGGDCAVDDVDDSVGGV